jgi:ribosomal protein S17
MSSASHELHDLEQRKADAHPLTKLVKVFEINEVHVICRTCNNVPIGKTRIALEKHAYGKKHQAQTRRFSINSSENALKLEDAIEFVESRKLSPRQVKRLSRKVEDISVDTLPTTEMATKRRWRQ